MKILVHSTVASLLVGCLISAASATPVLLDATQLDSVNAGGRFRFPIEDPITFLKRGSAIPHNLMVALPSLLAEAARYAPVAANALPLPVATDAGSARMAAAPTAPTAPAVLTVPFIAAMAARASAPFSGPVRSSSSASSTLN